jgi:hypothetical protein
LQNDDTYEDDVIETATGSKVPQPEPPAPPAPSDGEITLTVTVSFSDDERLNDVEIEPLPERKHRQNRQATFEDGRVVAEDDQEAWLFDPATATRWRVRDGLPTPPPPEGKPAEHHEWVESQIFESFGSDAGRRLALVAIRHQHSTSYHGAMSYRAPTATTSASVIVTPLGERVLIDAAVPFPTNDVHVHHSGSILVADGTGDDG